MVDEFKTTEEIKVPAKLIEQVIGQDRAVDIIKKAAKQKRNALLIGPPGTGKSLLAQAMAELMPTEELEDVLIYANQNNENQPIVRSYKTYPDHQYLMRNPHLSQFYTPQELLVIRKHSEEGKKEMLPKLLKDGIGRRMSAKRKLLDKPAESIPMTAIFLVFGLAAIWLVFGAQVDDNTKWLLLAVMFGFGLLLLLSNAANSLSRRIAPGDTGVMGPKLIVDNTGKTTAPFVEATGAKAGALLGDVKHDPLQTGGLGTPAHTRVEAGALHTANKGVLYIDEIASLKWNWQQELLTALQEKRYPITGQSDNSSGALVKTEPAPTDFVLVAAGNLPDMQHIHPALRSRIRGGGYEIYVEDSMEDNEGNRAKLVQFVAQEVRKDGKIPHFTREAVMQVIEEAKKYSNARGRLTLNLRELGGLVRAAGDIAREKGKKYVELEDVMSARKIFRSIESQLSRKMIDKRKEYQVFLVSGDEVGRVNGLAVLGDAYSGIMLPIVAEVTPPSSKSEGKVIATGKLGQIAKEAVDNVSAIIKKIGKDISKKDIHVQFLQTYEGVEGDSASISIAVAVISALENIPVRQNVAMTGSLDVRGDVMPVGGVTGKVEAALESGVSEVIIPASNEKDVYLEEGRRGKVKLIPVKDLAQVLEAALKDCKEKKRLIEKIGREFRH
ncbi:MAG: ATP-dependent protease LonB [Candidatus Bilamarchaeaceae archaeon]